MRKARGLTQEELEARSGVSQETISKLELRPNASRSVEHAIKLARALNTSVEALFGDQLMQTAVHVRGRERRAVAQSGDTGNGGTAA